MAYEWNIYTTCPNLPKHVEPTFPVPEMVLINTLWAFSRAHLDPGRASQAPTAVWHRRAWPACSLGVRMGLPKTGA